MSEFFDIVGVGAAGLGKFFFKLFFGACALPVKEIFILSRNMQRRDSLGQTTKIPRLRTGFTRRFKSRRSQSLIRDGDEERDAEAGAANVTPTDFFEEGEQTLILPDHRHREDPEEPGDARGYAGPSRDQEPALSLTKGETQGSPVERGSD